MNRKMVSLFAVVAFLLVGFGISHAQSNYNFTPSINSTVIITTGVNSIDSFSIYPIANLKGIPVISVNGTLISQSIVNNLTAQGIKTAIVIGGPVVISNATVTLLESAGINVIRIWGVTAPDTALSAVQYIMPKPVFSCAVLAYYNETPSFGYSYQFAASLMAARNKCLLFPTFFNNVPQNILSYLQEYNITNITFVGPNALPASIFANLTRLHLRNVLGNQSYIANFTYSLRLGRPSRILLVGVNRAAWNASLVLGSLPSTNSSIILIENASQQMPSVINEINGENITDVRVVGIPSMVNVMDGYLHSAGINYTSYGGMGEGLMRQTMTDFRNQIRSDNRYYAQQFNVSVDAATVRNMINDALQRFDYYNSTLQTRSIQNGTNLTAVYSALKLAYSLVLNANNSLNSGNITAAIRQLQQAVLQMNERLYYSNIRGQFVNDSVGPDMHSVVENTKGLINAVDLQLSQLNQTLTGWSSLPAFRNDSTLIRSKMTRIETTLTQIRLCAQQFNLTCLQRIGLQIKAEMQNTIFNAVDANYTRRTIGPGANARVPVGR